MKICTKCGVGQNESQYRIVPDKRKKKGFYVRGICDTCYNNRARKLHKKYWIRYYDKNKAELIKKTMKWRNENPEKVKVNDRKTVERVPDSYARKILKKSGWPESFLENEQLLNLKKQTLKIKHKIKNNEKVQKTKKPK